MYLICTKRPFENFNKIEALNNAVQYGYLAEEPVGWTVHAVVPHFEMARKVATFIADSLRAEVTIRSAYLTNGAHFSTNTVSPSLVAELSEALEELELYDGVPADTGSV